MPINQIQVLGCNRARQVCQGASAGKPIGHYQESNTITATISAKIPDELRKKARLYHIKISQVVRKAIEYEIKKIESKRLARDLDIMGRMLRKNVQRNKISRAVRSSRNER